MSHHTSTQFWHFYHELPPEVRRFADDAFRQLAADPNHPSLRMKKVGQYWAARVSHEYRALAVEASDGLLWIWIGRHDEYERRIG